MDLLIHDYDFQLIAPDCAPGAARWGVLVSVPEDISAVFPYVNTVYDNAVYDHENKVIIFGEQDQKYALRPNDIRVARVRDLSEAQQFVREIVEKVNKIWQERDSITPRYTERKRPVVIDIFKLLPRTNCKECGYATCMAFAADVSKGTAKLEQCQLLSQAEHTRDRENILSLFALD